MNFNTSPIAFFPSRAAQIWRAWFAQRKISVICGNDLLPFYIIDNGNAPASGELYDPNTDTKIADIDFQNHLLDHDITIDGQSAHIWIYQGEMSGVFGYTTPGYYYLKIGNWYSDVFRIGALSSEYTEINWQFFDDIITADGTPISKHIKYRQIFETPLWHPEYNIEEEGKTNNGIFYAMQQTTKKTSGFNAIVNESQIDCLNLTRMADNITVKACLNGTVKTMQTNQFEISSKWESDDVASIECQFDLFSIIRKYQQTNVEPEPLPIEPQPIPVHNYYIKGTSNANSVILEINGSEVSVAVENGQFIYGYDTKLTSFKAYDSNIMTINFAESCKLTNITQFSLRYCSGLTSANLNGCTFKVCSNMAYAFAETALTSVSLPDAEPIGNGDFTGLFYMSDKITSISMPKAAITDNIANMFDNCRKLADVTMPVATFADATSASHLFWNCGKLAPSHISMPAVTFASCENFDAAFTGFCYRSANEAFVLTDVFPSYVGTSVTTAQDMFLSSSLTSIDISAMDLSQCTNLRLIFSGTDAGTIAFDKANTGNVENFEQAFGTVKKTVWPYLSDVDMSSATSIKGAFLMGGQSSSDTQATFTLNEVLDTVENAEGAFMGWGGSGNPSYWLGEINMPYATLENATNLKNLFANNAKLETINAPALNLLSTATASGMFSNLPALENVTIGVSGTLAFDVSFAQSPLLTETSIGNIVTWLKDLTGDSAKTITFNSTAWNAMPAASQSTLASAIAAKNWNLQN